MLVVYDMHCHTHEFSDNELEDILEKLGSARIVSVSEDLESFYRTLELAERFPDSIIPCAGFHPWSIKERSLGEAEELARLAVKYGIPCIGEVGLDKKFLPEWTWDAQVKVFGMFLEAAREIDAYVTVHSPNAWREAVEMLVDAGIERAMLHWYTGPLNLIPEIVGAGYYISINPAIRIQEKHKRVAKASPLDHMVFESDGPYNYRGLRLTPLMIPDAVREVAALKGIDEETVWEWATRNGARLLRA
ncbi:MAG: TatD family hydrolase [Desulfurococcales archaeon]|nr:TatD family hydrolase [Desulfurococcales archaeon]